MYCPFPPSGKPNGKCKLHDEFDFKQVCGFDVFSIYSVGIGERYLKIRAPTVTSAVYHYACVMCDDVFQVGLSNYKITDHAGAPVANPFLDRPFSPVYYSVDEFSEIIRDAHECQVI